LPARSQVIRKIQLNSKEDSVLIPNQEIKHGINIASTTATSKNAFIRLLNTTNKDQEVSTNILAYESLSNYEAVKTNLENRENLCYLNFPKTFLHNSNHSFQAYAPNIMTYSDWKPNQQAQIIFTNKN